MMHITSQILKLVQQNEASIDVSNLLAPGGHIESDQLVPEITIEKQTKNVFDELCPGMLGVILFPKNVSECSDAASVTGPNGRILGIETSVENLEINRNAVREAGKLNIEFRLKDNGMLPVTSNIADIVISQCDCHFCEDAKTMFREVYRILKPGGIFSVSLKTSSTSQHQEEYANILKAGGFENIMVYDTEVNTDIIYTAYKPIKVPCQYPGCC